MNLMLSNEHIVVNSKSIPKIYGGFGNNQPSILAKQIANLHGYKLKEINQIVNNNLDWFDEGFDFIDLKSVVILNDHGIKELLLNFYSQEGLNRSVSIFLFSQQGYAMLCKLLKSDLAKQIYKQMVRQYFLMAESQPEISNGKLTQMASQLAANARQTADNAQQLTAQAEILKATIADMYRNKENICQNHQNILGLEKRVFVLEKKTCYSEQKKDYSRILECITPEQAEILKKRVKEKGRPISIWKKFNKSFGITRYKFLPKSQFQEAMEWIENISPSL